MTAKPLTARERTLNDLLLSGGGDFQVPDYQRPYQWNEDIKSRNPIQDLWDDVLEAAEGDKVHFFGTVLTTREKAHPGEDQPLQILDGQQRLTTFTLLLVTLDRELEDQQGRRIAQARRQAVKAARERIAKALFNGGGLRRLRLRQEDDPQLEDVLEGGAGSGVIGSSFETIQELVAEYLEGARNRLESVQRILDSALDRATFIHAHCEGESFDPFVVFSTLNATGVPLTAAQVLRARCFGLVRDLEESRRNETSQAWSYVESLADPKIPDEPDRFLRDYLIINTGSRIPMEGLVRRFDKELVGSKARRSPGERSEHLRQLHSGLLAAGRSWSALREGKIPGTVRGVTEWHVSRVRILMKELKLVQTMPLLVAVATRTPDRFLDLLQPLEFSAFVALTVLGNQTKWGEELYALSNTAYEDGLTIDEFKERVGRFFETQLREPVGTVFARRLPEEHRYNGAKKTRLRYFLTTLNDWGFPDPKPRSSPEEVTWVLSDIHIDHICARAGADTDIPPLERDRLGNLTPLKGKMNQQLLAKPYPEKREKYKLSPLSITRRLAEDRTAWSLASLNAREKHMVEFATSLFCQGL